MEIKIRKAIPGDEKILAYIQTESWKAAFSDIISPADLEKSTNFENVSHMYQRILQSGMCEIAILFVGDQPQCIAAWGQNRYDLGENVAELICIHSLQDKWRNGYGSEMMNYIVSELCQTHYHALILWVFEANIRTRKFYEKHDFRPTGQTKSFNHAVEMMYQKELHPADKL